MGRIDLVSVRHENNPCASYREFAKPALPKPSADDDVLGIGPSLELQKPANNTGKFLRKTFNSAVQDSGRLEVIADQDFIEFFLRYVFGRLVAERVIAGFLKRLPPGVQTATFRPDQKWTLLVQAFEWECLATTTLDTYFTIRDAASRCVVAVVV